MGSPTWIVTTVLVVLAVGTLFVVLWRSTHLRANMRIWLGALLLAVFLAVPSILLERAVERFVGLEPFATGGDGIALGLYRFLVRAPIEMALVVLATVPFWRLRRLALRAGIARDLETREALSLAIASSLGFSLAHGVAFVWLASSGWLDLLRVALRILTFVLLCVVWGWVLGRRASRGYSDRRFSTAWLLATLFCGVGDHLLFSGELVHMLAMSPIWLCLLVGVAWMVRILRPVESSRRSRFSMLMSTSAPSSEAIRNAFQRRERPLALRWIVSGALVTVGLIVTFFSVAVYVGNEMGIRFGSVDQPHAEAQGALAMSVLVLSVMAAFPVAGYLLARASSAQGVLEPAIATAVAVVLLMVFLGLLAPVTVVFVVAFAPVAFGLSCAGAWLGLAR